MYSSSRAAWYGAGRTRGSSIAAEGVLAGLAFDVDTGLPVFAERCAGAAAVAGFFATAAADGRDGAATAFTAALAAGLAATGRLEVAAEDAFFFSGAAGFDGFFATGRAFLATAFFFDSTLRAGAFLTGFDFFLLAAIAHAPYEIKPHVLPERDSLRNQADGHGRSQLPGY